MPKPDTMPVPQAVRVTCPTCDISYPPGRLGLKDIVLNQSFTVRCLGCQCAFDAKIVAVTVTTPGPNAPWWNFWSAAPTPKTDTSYECRSTVRLE